MKIVFTGGGTGGHFYPVIAVAEEIRQLAKSERLIQPELYFMSDSPYNPGLLYDAGIIFKKTSAGKIRRYTSILNFLDMFKTFWGILFATWNMFKIYPDVVFGKGGYGSFPALFAARLLRIPVVIHESDSSPGKVNIWAAKFAKRVAVSYKEAGAYFEAPKVAYTGNPIRKSLFSKDSAGAYEFLKLEKDIPVILILGGSQGARVINDGVVDALPALVLKYQIIHQTGKNNIADVATSAKVTLENSPHKDRYRAFEYLNDKALQMGAGISSLVISRAGSSIFEIALWGIPSIIVPIPEEISHDQRGNAFNYARAGAAVVIEEHNLSPHLLVSEIDRLFEDTDKMAEMSKKAKEFATPDAALKIAREILNIALEHEK